MDRVSPMVAGRSAFASSVVTNDLLAPLPGADGRSTWSRRRRDLIANLTNDMGRPLRERDRILINSVAGLIVRCEQLHVQIANGAEIDDDQLIRLSNISARLLKTLGLDKVRPQQQPATIDAYLAGLPADEQEAGP